MSELESFARKFCSKLLLWIQVIQKSPRKKSTKTSFFKVPLTIVTQTQELPFYSQWNCRNTDAKTVIPYTIDSLIFMNWKFFLKIVWTSSFPVAGIRSSSESQFWSESVEMKALWHWNFGKREFAMQNVTKKA